MICKRVCNSPPLEIEGGTHLEKGVRECAAIKTPFSALSAVPLDPHFSMFQFFKTKTPFSTKFPNFTKFAVLEPKVMQNTQTKDLLQDDHTVENVTSNTFD